MTCRGANFRFCRTTLFAITETYRRVITDACDYWLAVNSWTCSFSSRTRRGATLSALISPRTFRGWHAIPNQHVASTLGDFHFACGRTKTVKVASVRTGSDREFASRISTATAR